jgi:hypothetical protein
MKRGYSVMREAVLPPGSIRLKAILTAFDRNVCSFALGLFAYQTEQFYLTFSIFLDTRKTTHFLGFGDDHKQRELLTTLCQM